MSRDFGTVAQNITEAKESPILMWQGVSDYHHLQIDGTGTLASPTMVIYKENGVQDLSGTLLSGSMSVSGRVIKTKVIGGLIGGSNYKVYVYFTDGGVATVRQYLIIVPKFGVKPSKYQFTQDPYRIDESPLMVHPGQTYNASLVIQGEGTLASPVMTIYKGLDNSSGTNLSGSPSVVGRSITLSAITGLVGGSEYIAYITFTDNGKNTLRYLEIICPKLGL